jgi:hypothetical protein
MSKATRIRQQNARERVAAQRAAARKAEIRSRIFITGGSILAVVVVVVAFIIIKANQNSAKTSSAGRTALPASVIKDVTKVPAATLDAVGAGSAYAKSITSISGGSGGSGGSGTALASGGRPEVLYIGAEYCPYCATERWAMAVALSRFGTFSGLGGIHSAGGTEAYPNTATLTFYKSTYTSKYLTFTPVEETTVSKATLQKPTSQQQALITKYDYPPYIAAASEGAIPFIDFANKYLVHGAQFNPQLLQGQTWAQIAAALNDKSSSIGKGADGAANMITAALCKLTHNKPANVCTSSAVTSLGGQI